MIEKDDIADLYRTLTSLHKESKEAAVCIHTSLATIARCDMQQTKMLEDYAFRDVFRAIRKAVKLKQKSIAVAAGVSVSSVSRLETGNTYGIALSTLRRIVAIYANLEAELHGRVRKVRETSSISHVEGSGGGEHSC